MSAEIIKLSDPFFYVFDDENENEILAVMWRRDRDYMQFSLNGSFYSSTKYIPNHELRQLMIMWLALMYPDALSYDHLENENAIKKAT